MLLWLGDVAWAVLLRFGDDIGEPLVIRGSVLKPRFDYLFQNFIGKISFFSYR